MPAPWGIAEAAPDPSKNFKCRRVNAASIRSETYPTGKNSHRGLPPFISLVVFHRG